MPAQPPARDAAIVGLDDYAGRVADLATTDGRVPGERGRQTRQRLLDATVELLTTTSWRSVKVTDIARQARTSPATFYQYFGNVEQAIRVLAEGMVDQAAQLAELAGGDWSERASWDTARAVTEGFLTYWEDNRAVFRVVDLATEEGDAELRGIRVRALNAVTVALAQVIVAASPSGTGAPGTMTSSPAGADPMAVAGTLVAMFASVSAHRYGFEFWGIRTGHLVDTQARLLHWAVTGREAPVAEVPAGSREASRPRTGPVLGGATARRRSGSAGDLASPI
ncbi:MAG TPA: TetR family transcriptional regulator [Acidimicrobiales bacterium]|jgi:AcrR family transcriptional regulator|nr:TetR family transcriptional regulator [Acidimicrobiales bacterium]